MTKPLSLLSRLGRAATLTTKTTSTTNTTTASRVLASPPASTTTKTTTTQRNYATTATTTSTTTPTPTRTITTKSKSRGPALPMPEREVERAGHAYVVEAGYEGWPIPSQTAHTFVLQNAHKWAHKTALECGLTGRSYTYGQVYDGMMRFGGALQQLEVMKGAEVMGREEGKGPTVAILSPNSPEYPIAFFGSLAVGGTVTPVNPAFTPAEIARHLKDSNARVIVVDALLEPLADAALGLLGKEDKAWVDGGVSVFAIGASKSGRPDLRDIIADPNTPFARVVEPPLDSTAILPYSSGTTGLPKGVCHSHKAFSSSLNNFHHPDFATITSAEGENQEVLLGLLPFYHIYGLVVIMSSGLHQGAKIVTMPQFEPQAYVGILNKHKVSMLYLVPPLLNFMALSPAVPTSVLSNTHSVTCSAAPVPPNTAALLRKKAERPIIFQEGYGMTETMGTLMTPKWMGQADLRLKLVPHVRAKVVDTVSGDLLPAGQEGELCMDCSSMMTGYFNNEGATREAFDDEGWFRTGDVATYDEEGNFRIVDRLKELIKVKGIQVAPSEIEDLLLGHPGVAEVGVVGVPDEKAGEVPRAYVVPRSKDVKAQDLCDFVASKVARHKQLAGGVKFVEELPKNPTGKLLRLQLRKMASGE